MTYLVDTNVISEIRKRHPDPHVVAWWAIYQDHIINIDAGIAEEWGRLNVPDPLPIVDGLLAATARARGLILVTRNVPDLARGDVQMLNPFDPSGRSK